MANTISGWAFGSQQPIVLPSGSPPPVFPNYEAPPALARALVPARHDGMAAVQHVQGHPAAGTITLSPMAPLGIPATTPMLHGGHRFGTAVAPPMLAVTPPAGSQSGSGAATPVQAAPDQAAPGPAAPALGPPVPVAPLEPVMIPAATRVAQAQGPLDTLRPETEMDAMRFQLSRLEAFLAEARGTLPLGRNVLLPSHPDPRAVSPLSSAHSPGPLVMHSGRGKMPLPGKINERVIKDFRRTPGLLQVYCKDIFQHLRHQDEAPSRFVAFVEDPAAKMWVDSYFKEHITQSTFLEEAFLSAFDHLISGEGWTHVGNPDKRRKLDNGSVAFASAQPMDTEDGVVAAVPAPAGRPVDLTTPVEQCPLFGHVSNKQNPLTREQRSVLDTWGGCYNCKKERRLAVNCSLKEKGRDQGKAKGRK